MKVRFYRWYNAVLTALLSMLGYGCSTNDDPMPMYGVPVPEYGAPYADYVVKGMVTDEAGNPVQGIKTSLKEVYKTVSETYVYSVDSIQTNESGNFLLKYEGMPDKWTKLIVEDIDGEANGGEFQSDTLDVAFDKAKKAIEGDKSWYEGTYEVSQDIQLKKKQ